MRNRLGYESFRQQQDFCRVPIILTLLAILAFGEGGLLQGQTTVPEQSGPQQVGAIQTNQPAQTSQTQTNQSQNRRRRNRPEAGPSTLGLDQGFLEFDTPNFHVKPVKASQTLAALEPIGAQGFDFTPADQLESRAGDGFHHLGDVPLRLRQGAAPLSNIDPEGFATAAFHSSPSLMKWDAYSGDYGPNFFGTALNTATYLGDHPEFGWVAFGGNVKDSGNWVKVQPLDSFRRRIYIAPSGLWLTLDAGTFEGVEFNRKTRAVRLELSPQTPSTPGRACASSNRRGFPVSEPIIRENRSRTKARRSRFPCTTKQHRLNCPMGTENGFLK